MLLGVIPGFIPLSRYPEDFRFYPGSLVRVHASRGCGVLCIRVLYTVDFARAIYVPDIRNTHAQQFFSASCMRVACARAKTSATVAR